MKVIYILYLISIIGNLQLLKLKLIFKIPGFVCINAQIAVNMNANEV